MILINLEKYAIGFILGTLVTLLVISFNNPRFNEPCIQDVIHDTICPTDSMKVKASYYNNTKEQCDDSPNITANNTKITRKHDKKAVALSRDLFKKFSMGDSLTVLSPKHLAGKYLIFDTMNKRFKNKVDFFTFSKIKVDSITIQI
jgi:hypothetical protein